MTDIDHLLHKHTRSADVLKEHLREIAGDDLDLIRDCIEGETPLRDLISMAAEQNLADVGMVKGIEDVINAMRDRKDRIEKRIALRRTAILAAMQSAEIQKLETPAGTLSRKAVPPSALILDEAAVPSKFWKPQDPKIDKKAITEALKSGEFVAGCQMSNGGETLAVRT